MRLSCEYIGGEKARRPEQLQRIDDEIERAAASMMTARAQRNRSRFLADVLIRT